MGNKWNSYEQFSTGVNSSWVSWLLVLLFIPNVILPLLLYTLRTIKTVKSGYGGLTSLMKHHLGKITLIKIIVCCILLIKQSSKNMLENCTAEVCCKPLCCWKLKRLLFSDMYQSLPSIWSWKDTGCFINKVLCIVDLSTANRINVGCRD